MALTKSVMTATRNNDYFPYYGDGGGADVTLDEEFAPTNAAGTAVAFEFDNMRLHLSVAHVSIAYLRVWISSVYGSAHNMLLLSYLMSDVADIYWGPDRMLILAAGDKVCVSLGLSDSNMYGITMAGWGVTVYNEFS